MTSERLAAIVGLIWAILFAYGYKIRPWYGALSSDAKATVAGLSVIVTGMAIFGLSCANIIHDVTCTQDGALGLINCIIGALSGNVGTYIVIRKIKPYAPPGNAPPAPAGTNGTVSVTTGHVDNSTINTAARDINQRR